MDKEGQEKGFTVSDKRYSGGTKGEERMPSQDKTPLTPLPEMDFSTFLISISSTALLHFGDVPDPITNQKEKNLPMVKQTIDIIGMLKEKTKGNLTLEEENLIDSILYDLRMRYIKEVSQTS